MGILGVSKHRKRTQRRSSLRGSRLCLGKLPIAKLGLVVASCGTVISFEAKPPGLCRWQNHPAFGPERLPRESPDNRPHLMPNSVAWMSSGQNICSQGEVNDRQKITAHLGSGHWVAFLFRWTQLVGSFQNMNQATFSSKILRSFRPGNTRSPLRQTRLLCSDAEEGFVQCLGATLKCGPGPPVILAGVGFPDPAIPMVPYRLQRGSQTTSPSRVHHPLFPFSWLEVYSDISRGEANNAYFQSGFS